METRAALLDGIYVDLYSKIIFLNLPFALKAMMSIKKAGMSNNQKKKMEMLSGKDIYKKLSEIVLERFK